MAVQTTEQKMRDLDKKTQQDTNTADQLRAIVAEKETKIKELEEQMEKLKQEVGYWSWEDSDSADALLNFEEREL